MKFNVGNVGKKDNNAEAEHTTPLNIILSAPMQLTLMAEAEDGCY